MITFRRFLRAAMLLPSVCVTACSFFSDDDPHRRPSPFDKPPPAPPEVKQELRGGFTVPVEVPGQPTAPRVVSDIGTFAQARGFVRQGGPATFNVDPVTHQPSAAASERYLQGKIMLDLSYDATHLRVVAFLHSPGSSHDRKLINQFDQDFAQQYGGRYGDQATIVESDFPENPAVPLRSGGGDRRR